MVLAHLALVLPAASCAGGTDNPPYPKLSDVPSRPEGLPSQELLDERRRRLEADRDATYGRDVAAEPVVLEPEPLPALTETMADLPVARPSSGLAAARPGVSVQVATVDFPGDSPDLDDAMIEALSLAAREQQSSGGGIRVIGYGGAISSEDLAQRQVAAIGRTLIRMGVPPTRISTELGSPGASEASDHGRAVIYLDY